MSVWVGLLSFAVLLASSTSPHAASLFYISSPKFSVTVNNRREPVGVFLDGKVSRSMLTGGRLYFSFRINGTKQAIDHLNNNGKLSVRVTTWGRFGKLKDYDVGITQDDWERDGDAWVEEQKQDETFKWRTKLWIGQLEHSSITVTIEDENGTRVSLQGADIPFEAVATIGP
jgi:hypothetical protein